jgi:TatD DNase family protein
MHLLVDSHCHLTNDRFAADLPEVLALAQAAEAFRLLTIGTGLADGRKARELARQHPDLIACAVGLDPFSAHEVSDFAEALAGLESLLNEGGFCALGEIGLEFHHDVGAVAVQRERFAAQLDLARRCDLPVVIHVRDGSHRTPQPSDGDLLPAHAEALSVLRAHPGRGVIHSFAGGPNEARRYLELGWHLAFNGMVTYPRNTALREAAALVPADRLLIETDAPYLPPQSRRGRRNEPAFVAEVAAAIADLRGERCEDVVAWTCQNACTLFRWPRPW